MDHPQSTVNAGDEAAAGDVLEALNVIAANQPLLLLGDGSDGGGGRSLEMVGTAMLTLAASSALEVPNLCFSFYFSLK